MDTPRFLATSLGGTPLARSFLADSILLSVILGLRPPFRPSCRATSRPARVRSTIRPRSISAKLAMTWKKKRPEGVPVSMASVRLLNWTPCLCSSPTRSLQSGRIDHPSRTSKALRIARTDQCTNISNFGHFSHQSNCDLLD